MLKLRDYLPPGRCLSATCLSALSQLSWLTDNDDYRAWKYRFASGNLTTCMVCVGPVNMARRPSSGWRVTQSEQEDYGSSEGTSYAV